MNHRARFSLHCQFPGPLAFSHQDHMLTVAVALMVKSERQAKSETKTKGGAGVRASSRKLFLHLGAAHPFLSTLISKNNRVSWMTHKLESRFLGEMPTTSDACMYNSPICCSKCFGLLGQKLLKKRTHKTNILFKCHCVYVYWFAKCLRSGFRFFFARTVVYQASKSMEFPRQEHWSVLPFPSPEDLPNQRIKHTSPHWYQGGLRYMYVHAYYI